MQETTTRERPRYALQSAGVLKRPMLDCSKELNARAECSSLTFEIEICHLAFLGPQTNIHGNIVQGYIELSHNLCLAFN